MMDSDTPTEFDDDSYDPASASASPWSCLFPEECCMPGPHGPDECHTAKMVDEYEDRLCQWGCKTVAHAGGRLCNDCLTRLAWSVGK